MIPIGSIIAYVGTAAFLHENDPDYHMADGSTLPAKEYKNLAKALGVQGDIITLPDLRDRFLKGAKDESERGKQGGSASHSHSGSTAKSTTDLHNSGDGRVQGNSIYHTHAVTISEASHEPPFSSVVWIIRVR